MQQFGVRSVLDERLLPRERLHLLDIDALAQESEFELDGCKGVKGLRTMLVL